MKGTVCFSVLLIMRDLMFSQQRSCRFNISGPSAVWTGKQLPTFRRILVPLCSELVSGVGVESVFQDVPPCGLVNGYPRLEGS
jgi:hypothetical protein